MPDRDAIINALSDGPAPSLADVVRNFWNPLRGPDPVRQSGLDSYGLLSLPPLPKSRMAELRNYTPPGPPRVQSEVAEAISPTMGGYGMGNLLATAGLDAAHSKFDPETWGMLAAGMLTPGASKGRPPPRVSNPIKAYHGSPHDFDKFSMDKIGTGEGAQAYGHGLYFAESEPVAKSYRDALSGADLTMGGRNVGKAPAPMDYNLADPRHAEATAAYILTQSRAGTLQGKIADAMDILKMSEQQYAKYQRGLSPEAIAQVRSVIGRMDGDPGTVGAGKMYEVALHATPEQFLDWDKPLSGQSPQVRATLDRLGVEQAPHLNESYLSVVHSLAPKMGVGEVPFEQVRSRISDALAKEGVPGIRYLDQGSRGAGQGTSNYVVWNPEIIEILRKYGIAGPGALGLANALSQESPNQ